MSSTSRPTGHLQIKSEKGQRAYWAFWRDESGVRAGKRLGPAHVRDSGRRSARGAIIWRAGDGPRPTPEHLTPKDAQEQLDAILRELAGDIEQREEASQLHTLFDATQGWVAERHRDKDLKRATLTGYEVMFERLYRDLGAQTPLQDFLDGRLRSYFDDFPSYKVISEKTAMRTRAEGKNVELVEVERWTAQPHDSLPVEVATKDEAVRIADELPGTWHHLRRGAYRVVPLNAQRAKSVTYAKAKELEADGWIVARRKKRLWMLVAPAAAQTRNEYRDIFSACLNYAVRQRWIPANPLVEVKRRSKREQRERVLRRDDFYDPSEIDRLLKHAPRVFEEAFWLCGAHAGLRLSGEALGLRWGAVDFNALILRPYDNWVLNQLDTPKTSDCEAIPMTPRLARALLKLKQRGYATSDEDFVFVSEPEPGRPVRDKPLRAAFKLACQEAGLKPIKMYNLRHSFGTSLAAKGVDVRTIQGLMRHARLNTTEQYMAYAPRPELANQITRALDPESLPENVTPIRAASTSSFLERLEEEIPAKWLHEVERIFAEGNMPLPSPDDSAIPGERVESQRHLTAVEAPQDR
ncbi:MAG TPA: site-specific integrase [Solirubrobacteraceae bacterium]|nr:site-specific integrase [Solirubrobacteraceae bacterium]